MELTEKFDILKSVLLPIAVSLWMYWLWTRKDMYLFSLRQPGFIGLPILGSLLRIKSINNVIPELGAMFRDCKSYTFSLWLGIRPVLMTADPIVMKEVLSSNNFLDKALPLYRPLYAVFRGGIIASPASEWRHNRKVINPSFYQKLVLSFVPIFNKSKNLAILKLHEMSGKGELRLSQMLQRLMLGITVETTMGKEMKEGDLVSEDLLKAYTEIIEEVPRECFLSYMELDYVYGMASRGAKRYIHKYISGLIKNKLKQLTNGRKIERSLSAPDENSSDYSLEDEKIESLPNIFIEQALQIYLKGQLRYRDVFGEANTIVTASFETSANAVLSVLVMLAMHPHIQERLFEEILSVFPDKTFEVENEHIDLLPYLDMVIHEAIRLVPPIPMIGRHVVKDTKLADMVVPKGYEILLSIFDLHRRKDLWGPNADKFDPDNFLPANIANRNPYAYMPFSKGLRSCIGSRYAILAMKVMLAGILRNFSFATNYKYEDLSFANHVSIKYYDEPSLIITRRSV